MNEERVGDIVLHGNDAIRLAYMLYRPTEEELLYNMELTEREKAVSEKERELGIQVDTEQTDFTDSP